MRHDSDSPVTERADAIAGVTQRAAPSHPPPAETLADAVTQRAELPPPDAALLEQVTARLKDESALLAILQLQPGTQVADRYRIEAGPLGGISGEAEIYRCHDERTGMQVALKLYRHNMAPKADVLKSLVGLVHPDIVSVKDYGTWNGRFYEVMEYCLGGSMADAMPLSEAQLRTHIPQLVNGLRYCHQQGIIHRDIKPSNLFFRDRARTESVLGDFGISSMLESHNNGVRVTQTAANLTLDYAAPELLDGHTVGPKTDYYSLGVTLIHLLTGQSPFTGMSNTDILVAHLRGRIQVPTQISAPMQELLRGLLQVRPENRWGYRQIYAWLNNEPVLRDDGTPWRDQQGGRAAPGAPGYPGFPQARTPQELAKALDQFDAAKQLFRGDIRRWIFDHHDPALAERIGAIEENDTRNPALGVHKLRHLLDPSLPLHVGPRKLHNLGELLDLLLENEPKLDESLIQLLFSGMLGAWMGGLQEVPQREILLRKVALIAEKLRHKDPGVALFALRCTLDPQQPLPLQAGVSIPNPGAIEDVLGDSAALHKAFAEQIARGYMEQWLRAAEFPNWEEDVKFLRQCLVLYANNLELLAWAVRWRYRPELPISFHGVKISDPTELAQRIDQSTPSRQAGEDLLSSGWLRAWLVSTGRIADPDALDQVLWDTRATLSSKLETVLQLMNPRLEKPRLAVAFSRINFGPVDPETPLSKSITIRNSGRGHLSGELRLEHTDRGFRIDRYTIEGNQTLVRVSAASLGMPELTRQQTHLHITSNGGNHTIHLAYQVPRHKDNSGPPDLLGFARAVMQRIETRHITTLVFVILVVLQLGFCQNIG